MNLRSIIYTQKEEGTLHFVAEGECGMYCPDQPAAGKVIPPHVTLSLGNYVLHINKEDFTKFCRKFLYNGE